MKDASQSNGFENIIVKLRLCSNTKLACIQFACLSADSMLHSSMCTKYYE